MSKRGTGSNCTKKLCWTYLKIPKYGRVCTIAVESLRLSKEYVSELSILPPQYSSLLLRVPNALASEPDRVPQCCTIERSPALGFAEIGFRVRYTGALPRIGVLRRPSRPLLLETACWETHPVPSTCTASVEWPMRGIETRCVAT